MPDLLPESLPIPPAHPTAGPQPSWLRRVLLNPLLDLLKAGLSPEKLALTVGLGAAIGIGPLFGLTTITCAIVALRLRLNVAAMQLVCHLLTPVQVLLLLPLLRWGARLMGQGAAIDGLTVAKIREMIHTQGWGMLQLLWRAEVGALLIWAAVAVPLVAVLYFGLRPVFRQAGMKLKG